MNNPSPDGIVLLAKMPGLTSFASLNNVKKSLNTTKVGHTGTLDSFAQGLLVVCTGRLTKLAGNITEFDKSYSAVLKFGIETDTLDYTGAVCRNTELPLLKDLCESVKHFTGKLLQTPPVYSAIHVDGKRASDMARKGETVEIPKREITVFESELVQVILADGTAVSADKNAFSDFMDCAVSFAKISFSVSKGTYIRSLARDIALDCKSSAHLIGLLRTKVGNFLLEDSAGFNLLPEFTIENCISYSTSFLKKIEERQNEDENKKNHQKYIPTPEDEIIKKQISQGLQSFSEECASLCGFNAVHLVSDKACDDFLHGRPLHLSSFSEYITNTGCPQLLSVFYNERFYGLVEFAKNGKLYYRFVLN